MHRTPLTTSPRSLCLLAIVLALPSIADPLTSATARNFAENDVPALMEEHHVKGGAIAIVRGDDVLLSTGFGVADLETQGEIDPATTLFEVASVSKLFTTTAVMQQFERKKLDLHTDINTYLDTFQIPATFLEPITLRSLLTHTAGLDEKKIGTAVRSPGERRPLADWLAAELPPRVRPPGVVMSYSNMGLSLAGYSVECVTGEAHIDYVNENVLAPLGMTHSVFGWPEHLRTHRATPYVRDGDGFRKVPYNYMHDVGAGGLIASADDMAQFMIAHLNGGANVHGRILAPETTAQMQVQHFTLDPRIPGMALGFHENFVNGYRGLGHGGYLRGFATELIIFPELDLGIFVTNNFDAQGFGRKVTLEFMDRFFPRKESRSLTKKAGPEATQYTGTYAATRNSQTTLEKMAMLTSQIHVSLKDGRLHYGSAAMSRQALDLFWIDDYKRTVWFDAEGIEGRALMVRDNWPYLRLAWWETQPAQYAYMVTALLAFVSCANWPLRRWGRRRKKKSAYPVSRSRQVAGLTSACFGIFLAGLIAILLTYELYEFGYGIPLELKVLLWLPIIGTGGALLVAPAAVLNLRRTDWHWLDRAHYVFIAIVSALFVPWLIYWNLLGFNY